MAERLRARAARIVHAIRPFRGNVDGVIDGAVQGWVIARDAQREPLRVGLFTTSGLLVQGTANLYRGDLERAGIGDGWHGFALPLTPAIAAAIRDCGGRATVRVLGGRGFLVGHVYPNGPEAASPRLAGTAPAGEGGLRGLLFGDAMSLAQMLQDGPFAPPPPRPLGPIHAALVSDDDPIGGPGARLPPGMTAYGDYVRHRCRLAERFDTAEAPGGAAHFLNWYLAGYSVLRQGLRVPLSAGQIAYLNEPVVIGGQTESLSRATWQFLVGVPPLVQSMDFGNPAWIDWVVYWWSVNHAYALHVEDCLVPEAYAERLRRPVTTAEGEAPEFAPSEFLLRLRAETPALSRLDIESREGRRDLALAAMTMAGSRPDFLRFIPAGTVSALLDDNDGESAFSRFFRELTGRPSVVARADYAGAIARLGYDLESGRFLSLSAEGHRMEAVRCPRPAPGLPDVDVQIIGPFEKASGLGQATRLSARALASTGLRINAVDFDLDNPAPEGFSNGVAHGDYRRARINLLHLNAESIPLAFAYQPDVFSGAYNIGYFFWELDSPADCHHLALSLLDEIWVSTDYGVSIFRDAARGPVTNVGMCVEDLPPGAVPDRAEARAFLERRTGAGPGDFVFIVVFDSFSFVQRKNPVGTLRAFGHAFPADPDVRLIVKTQNRRKVSDPVQLAIWQEIDALVAADPRIVFVDETLDYGDLLRLKKGCDAYVSLHRSEGWGFGMIEAMNLGLPVLCTGYSGNLDFCSEETAWLVSAREVPLGPDDYIFVRPGQKWAEPDLDDAARQMRAVRADPAERARRAEAALRRVRTDFSAETIGRRYGARLQQILADRPREAPGR